MAGEWETQLLHIKVIYTNMLGELKQLLETTDTHLREVDAEYVKILTASMEWCKPKKNCLLSQAAALVSSQPISLLFYQID